MNLKYKIFVYPTDTLYGICASAFSKKNVERIYDIKGRTPNKPFIVLISSLRDLKKFGIILTQPQKKFLEKNWPNQLSVILPCPYKKFDYLHRGTKSIAFRIPKKKYVREFLKLVGPIVAPSANPQGKEPAQTIQEAKKYFGDTVDAYIAKGRLVGSPSTLIAFKKEGYSVLRQGAYIPKE